MDHFAYLIKKIEDTSSASEKVAALAGYFSLPVSNNDKLWALALLSQKVIPNIVSPKKLNAWIIEITNLPIWLIDSTNQTVGDLAETMALVFPFINTKNQRRSLSEWIEDFNNLGVSNEDVKREQITCYWTQWTKDERYIFHKLLTGRFKGISKSVLIPGLSQSLGISEIVISQRLMRNWSTENTTWKELFFGFDSADELAKPYPFLMADTSISDTKNLGSPSEWAIEYKWDGIRVQIIRRSTKLFIWTLGNELITEIFPETHALKNMSVGDFVMDGVIVPYDKEVLPFHLLQNRVSRKKLTKNTLLLCPIAFMAHDLLEHDNIDIRHETYEQRRNSLAMLVEEINLNFIVILTKSYVFSDWNEVKSMRSNAALYLAGGIMLKRLKSPYEKGCNTGLWLQWKVDSFFIDAVLVYAHKTENTLSNLFTEFTFALWHVDEKGNPILIPFTKASSGLTENEKKEITEFVKKNKIEKFGPVHSVKPHLVFEIMFEGITYSKRHKSGVTLSSPSIKAWHKDKTIEDIAELSSLLLMLKQGS